MNLATVAGELVVAGFTVQMYREGQLIVTRNYIDRVVEVRPGAVAFGVATYSPEQLHNLVSDLKKSMPGDF